KVHNTLGPGFLEAVYEEAMEKEFMEQGIPFKRQVKLAVFYGEHKLNKFYKADFVCYDKIILEVKAVAIMPKAFYLQLKNYLTATKKDLGMLINFGQKSLDYKRIVDTNHSR